MASAASITNVQFSNNQTTTSCTAGETVNMTFRVNVPSGEVVELGQVDVLGDNIAPALPSILGGDLGLQEGPNDVQMSVICPQNTGYYSVQFNTAGIYGGQRAVTMSDGVTSSATFSNAIRVTATGTTSGSTTVGSNDAISQLQAMVAALIAKLNPTPATPVTSTKCAALAEHMGGAMFGVKNQANVTLQGYLLGEGASIPALAAGASFGFWGPQTQAALVAFKAANGCN